MADFIFRVKSARLTGAHQEQIATAIEGAVLTGLAELDSRARAFGPEV